MQVKIISLFFSNGACNSHLSSYVIPVNDNYGQSLQYNRNREGTRMIKHKINTKSMSPISDASDLKTYSNYNSLYIYVFFNIRYYGNIFVLFIWCKFTKDFHYFAHKSSDIEYNLVLMWIVLAVLYVSYIDDMHMVIYSCGARNGTDCDRGWITAYARHAHHDEHIDEQFNTTKHQICLGHKQTYNLTEHGMWIMINLLYW